MKRLALLTATAAAGPAAATLATPASAQYPYPNPYPQQYPYGYNNNGANVIGSIINSVLGYGRYPYGNYGYGQPGYQTSQRASIHPAVVGEPVLVHNPSGRRGIIWL